MINRTSDSVDYKSTSDIPFYIGLILIGGLYIFFIVGLLFADTAYTTIQDFKNIFGSREIRFAIRLSLFSCSLTALLSIWVAVPIGYLMSRFEFPGKSFLDAVLDIPIVLPPLVIGLSLLIFFQTSFGKAIERIFPITYALPSVILAQLACVAGVLYYKF